MINVGGQELTLETGEIGRQANGAVMAKLGDTMLYTTACCSNEPAGDGSFLPLQVHYAERFSAAGRTSSGFVKRDGRPKESETLVSRLVDRSLRPAFAPGWTHDTQVLQWVMSYDNENATEALAITAASAALAVSDIPASRVVAGVRVGLLEGQGFVINPTVEQMEASSLDLLLAGSSSAVLMIEGFADFLPEDQLLEAIRVGHEAVAQQCTAIETWAAAVGRQKRDDFAAPAQDLDSQIEALVGDRLREAYRSGSSKQQRGQLVAPLWEEARQALVSGEQHGSSGNGSAAAAEQDGIETSDVDKALKRVESHIMRRLVVDDNLRADGRSTTEVRPISSRAGGFLPRTHGCALFTRGETQALAVTTLGSESSAQKLDAVTEDEEYRHFYLQYFFPPSSVGETGRIGGAGRREVGHGNLAERALAPAVPPRGEFPYTVRVESTITESNGSSSMASVCGGCLAMLDAGVPLKTPVAGVAMGLILESDGRFVILTDILGSEDALGDMDFKVAGSADGVTAFQMDIKVEGITLDIMQQALGQARDGRRHILAAMQQCAPPPRGELSPYAPRIGRLQVPVDKIGVVIGPGGRNIQAAREASGADSINIEQDGWVTIVAYSTSALEAALKIVRDTVAEIEPGQIYRNVKVSGVQAFGCFVEVLPGKEGLVHISELDLARVDDPAVDWSVGKTMDVLCVGIFEGKPRLSRREVLLRDAGEEGAWSWPDGGDEPQQTPDGRHVNMRKATQQPANRQRYSDNGSDSNDGSRRRNGRQQQSRSHSPAPRSQGRPQSPRTPPAAERPPRAACQDSE